LRAGQRGSLFQHRSGIPRLEQVLQFNGVLQAAQGDPVALQAQREYDAGWVDADWDAPPARQVI